MSKFIIRLDDVHEGMNFVRFDELMTHLDLLSIRPIIGVIPNNHDQSLISEKKISREIFWKKIKSLFDTDKCDIALHGYDHVYVNKNRGLLKYGKKSEFSGLDYKTQYNKIKRGLNIFEEHGIKTNIFMAPSHSFDINTLKVLYDLDIKYVTDGFNLFPYKKFNIIFIPQLFASFKNFGFGLYSVCIHLDNYTESDYLKFKSDLINHSRNITSFSSEKDSWNTNFITSFFYVIINLIFKFLRK